MWNCTNIYCTQFKYIIYESVILSGDNKLRCLCEKFLKNIFHMQVHDLMHAETLRCSSIKFFINLNQTSYVMTRWSNVYKMLVGLVLNVNLNRFSNLII